MKEIYLLLGSNIGDRSTQLSKAVSALDHPNLKVNITSKLYETAAWGKTDQASFLNQVLKCESDFSPLELLGHCQDVEKALGRERFELWGPRTIDIDILYFGQESHNTKSLIIPHPGIALRGFTLAPLSEIAPEFKHPLLGLTNEQLLEICPDQLEVLPYSPPIES
ncbi:MAG: 2-amino-4-hydroxy-6-hydroxymethyldihydropteridine diphosphokinase [Cyclobacteriaceae bacterium]